ncbi:hypothetical protein EVJ58_g6264 [Rhodofomes roseus]|uniref:F-box domain-containing protein n=1 Tax=Rhodofomes roseus TaxID=34475 RepID=A0A4Y9YCT2_9APHY|nr:hypothetical protein EVJ58_g6264 [Rhodofomes roseus]
MAPSFLQLDLDVIAAILEQVEPSDALHLAETCRAAQKVATPRFLSEVNIGPDWQKDGRNRVENFSKYMLQRSAERIPHLKTLIISSETFIIGESDPETGEMYVDFNFTSAVSLAAVVRRASRLRKLSIGCSEFLFEGVPELAVAVASISNIQEMIVTQMGIRVARVLSRMRSRPRSVECSILEMRDEQEAQRYLAFRPGRDRFLDSLTECMEMLKLENIGDVMVDLEFETVWPRVHALSVTDTLIVDLNLYAKAFPNLRRLYINAVSVNKSVDARDVWTHLDFLALHWPRCPVFRRIRWLRFNFTLLLGGHSRNAMRYAESDHLLRVTRPSVLDALGTPALFKCVAGTAPSVKFLRVCVTATSVGSASGQIESLDSWIENVTAHLKQIQSLRGLAIVSQRRTLERRDEYARGILAAHPSLEYVGFAAWDQVEAPLSWADQALLFTWYHASARPENAPPVVEMLRVGAGNAAYQSLLDTPLSQ